MSDVKDYSQLKERLDQIVEAVNDEDISLDDALALYEEAVKLGSKASALIEEDINAKTAEELAAAEAAAMSEDAYRSRWMPQKIPIMLQRTRRLH